MKVFLLVLLACVVVGTLAQDGSTTIIGAWAGDTSTSTNLFRAPNNSPCNVAAGDTTYLAFNLSITQSGVREVVLMAEPAFKGNVRVFLYQNAFIPTDSCNSSYYVRELTNSNFGQAGVLTIDDPVYFAAGTTYYFVVSSLSASVNGKFVLQVWGSVGSGSTTAASPTWNPSFFNTTTQLCDVYTSVNQTFGIVQWTQAATGYYDLVALFDVAAGSGAPLPSMWWSLYSGTFTEAQIATGGCSGTLGTSFRINANEGDRTAVAWRQQLTLNQVYTVAISNTYNGNFGFAVVPTRLAFVQGTSGWNQPGTTPPCAASANTNAPYYVYPIASSAVSGPFYIVDTENLPTYLAPTYVAFDTESFAYQGTVTGTPPTACPSGTTLLNAADTGGANGPLVFNTTSGQTYSVIVSDSTGAALTDPASAVYVYAFTGVAVSTSTSTSTSSTTASSSTTSTSATTGAATSGSSSNATTSATTSTSTSPASSLAVSAFLLFAGALALLL